MDETRKVLQLKAAEYSDKGAVKAVFSTFNVIDHDGDMMLPGSIGNQQVRMSAYGHRSWQGELPVGKGRIYEQGNEAIFEGQFFLTTQISRDTYETVKAMGDMQEWSFALPEIVSETRSQDGRAYRAIKSVRVPEVSPVLMGAGVNTRTLDVKAAAVKTAIPPHTTATEAGVWDSSVQEKNAKSDQPEAYYARIYAWRDASADAGLKSTYKFTHHFVDADGTPGKASTRACVSGIAVLNGARGGTQIPDADRKGVWNHLARHLRDADIEPPELKELAAEPQDLKLADHVDLVLDHVAGVTERVKSVAGMRELQGRGLSKVTAQKSRQLATTLRDAARMIESIVDEGEAAFKELTRFEHFKIERR